jgi:hypothetical protein
MLTGMMKKIGRGGELIPAKQAQFIIYLASHNAYYKTHGRF